jgi:hypothetical protein
MVIVGVDGSVPVKVVDCLRRYGAVVIDYSSLGWTGTSRMLWRFIPMVERSDIDVLASRDVDSALYDCDLATVQAWLELGTLTMTIRDSISHGSAMTGPQYLGGLCSFRWRPSWRALKKSLYEYAEKHIDPAGCGVDQAWLSYCVYPLFRDSYSEFGSGGQGQCEHRIVGERGPVHLGAPGCTEAPEENWEALCESCA